MSLIDNLSANRMARIVNSLDDEDNPECDVNGVWNAILRRYFCAPGFIIKPEEPLVGGRPDLIVSRPDFPLFGNVDWYYHLIYEGKRNLGDNQTVWIYMRDIILGYANGATTQNGNAVYCMGAVGTHVAFWHYRKGDNRALKPLDRVMGVVGVTNNALPTSYHLEQDRVDIVRILQFIRDNLP
ncbi:hypothetical protein BDV93DRAFT_587531 [Ceratobasidium sp. AG-I]|nr:hypothetical protein BDV93DRAFT_587531 [Ceratobasidium sp. AG-I]